MKQTHFGFSDVAWDTKQGKVDAVFASVAERYDIMNDLMSLGIHRLWKRCAVAEMSLRSGDHVLDLAGGTGDMTQRILPKIGGEGRVVLADINSNMLAVGKARLFDLGIFRQVSFSQVNAECLPFATSCFDHIMIAFGLRNVRDQMAALESMYRVLKPGGRLTILEFSTPVIKTLQYWYDIYSFSVLPWLGSVVADDAESYRYLAESIRRHPNQAQLKSMLDSAGFEDTRWINYSAGIVACHQGIKY